MSEFANYSVRPATSSGDQTIRLPRLGQPAVAEWTMPRAAGTTGTSVEGWLRGTDADPMGGAGSTVIRDERQWLEASLRMHDAAVALLDGTPGFEAVVFEAIPYIRSLFGAGVRMSLDASQDPESAADHPTLVLRIHSEMPPGEAEPLLDELDQSWWLDAKQAAPGRMIVTVVYS